SSEPTPDATSELLPLRAPARKTVAAPPPKESRREDPPKAAPVEPRKAVEPAPSRQPEPEAAVTLPEPETLATTPAEQAPPKDPREMPPLSPEKPAATPPAEEKTPDKEADLRKARADLQDAQKRDDRPAIEKTAKRVLELAPKTEKHARASAHAALGRNEVLAGHTKNAEAQFTDALALEPELPLALFGSFCGALILDDPTLAETRRKALKEHAPDSPLFQNARELALFAEGGRGSRAVFGAIESGQVADPGLSKAVVAALKRRRK
ncbi:hypothetical protein HY251_14705, partial [bacterium]|nr:hypothetical protein [bacterium]